MTNAQIKLSMAAKLKGVTTEGLKEMAQALFDDTRQEADAVLDITMDALMDRLPENEFVKFCEAM